VRRATLCHSYSKECLGEVYVLCNAVQHLLSCSVEGFNFDGCAMLYIKTAVFASFYIAPNLISAQGKRVRHAIGRRQISISADNHMSFKDSRVSLLPLCNSAFE
jgi:hypothetical protein